MIQFSEISFLGQEKHLGKIKILPFSGDRMFAERSYQRYNSPQGWYSLLFPSHWEMEIIEDIPAFFDPKGDGALQVFAFNGKGNQPDPETSLREYLQFHEIEYDEEMVAKFTNNQDVTIRACEFEKEKRHWLVYIASNSSYTILATYNSGTEPSEEVFAILSNIISSIQFN